MSQKFHKGRTVRHDLVDDDDDEMNGSAAAIGRFLRELVGLAGQDGQDAVPVLELHLGDIITRTSLEMNGENHLLITALLPRGQQACQSLFSSWRTTAPVGANEKIEMLWHAEAGCYMLMRRIPVAALSDERAVMDEILTTSDEAAAWFSLINSAEPRT